MPDTRITMEPGQGPRYRAQLTLDIGRMTEDTDFAPEFTVADGMKDYLEWLGAGNEF